MIRNRKYRIITILFVTIVMFGGCFNNRWTGGSEGGCGVVESDNSLVSRVDDSFFFYVQTIPILDSNFTLSSKEDFEHIDIQSKFIPEGSGLIGRLKPINNYEFIIYSYPADIRLPILEVYNLKGEKVNSTVLFTFEYCSQEFEDAHEVKVAPDHSKIYRLSYCESAEKSPVGYDSLIVQHLISHLPPSGY